MIQVEHFSYSYGGVNAVEDVSFGVKKGEIVALVGPNGAGKSTTMKVLTTQLVPCGGKVRVAGYDVIDYPEKVRENLGYLPENSPLYLDMLVFDALKLTAKQRKVADRELAKRIDEVALSCGLTQVMHRQIETLSKGYRQRVGIAQAMIHHPAVLILDEATSGLDPNQIREIRDLIVGISQDTTVIISTHILQEVTAIAERVLLMHRGRIVCDGKMGELLEDPGLLKAHPNPTIEDWFSYHTMG